MQSEKKDSERSFVYSAVNGLNSCMPWWNPSSSLIPEPSDPNNLYVDICNPVQHSNEVKQRCNQLQERESSSSQTTGHDSLKVERCEGQMKQVLKFGSQEAALPSPMINFGQSITCIPYPYADPSSYGGIVSGYESYTVNHSLMGMVSLGRVPLPLEPAENEPIYVNAKQYNGILRRRQLRAKLEAQNKLIKVRKPYLHESRHVHATKRARGPGGRFLNTNKPQQLPTIEGQNDSSSLLKLGSSGCDSDIHQGHVFYYLENSFGGISSITPSESTLFSSNGVNFQQHEDHLGLRLSPTPWRKHSKQ